jgi:hypothetical protein
MEPSPSGIKQKRSPKMSKSVPQILIKFRNRSKKNHEISSQVNAVIQKAFSDFLDAMPEILDPEIDPYLSMCLDEAWTKLSSLRDMFNIAAHSREKDYLGFEQMVKTYQETN